MIPLAVNTESSGLHGEGGQWSVRVFDVLKHSSDDHKGNWWCASQVFGLMGALRLTLQYPPTHRASILLDDLAK